MDLLRGLNTAPWLVGLARAIVSAVVAAIIAWLGVNANLLPESLQWAVPAAVLVLRQVEALFDQARASAAGATAIAPVTAAGVKTSAATPAGPVEPQG